MFSSEAALGGITIADPATPLRLPIFIAMDPPKHDAQRKVVSPAVSPFNLQRMEPLIRADRGNPDADRPNAPERTRSRQGTVMSAEPFEAPPRTYPIGHLCRQFGVTGRTLRYYEELGLLAPHRQCGARRYSRKDRARLILILQGRAVGMPLAEVGYLLDLYERGGRAAQHADALSIFRRQLLQGREARGALP